MVPPVIDNRRSGKDKNTVCALHHLEQMRFTAHPNDVFRVGGPAVLVRQLASGLLGSFCSLYSRNIK